MPRLGRLVSRLGLLVGLLVGLASCSPASSSAVAHVHGTSALVRGEVVDVREGDRYGETLTLVLDDDPIDLGSTKTNQTSLELSVGDEVEITYSDGNYAVGQSYAIFIVDSTDDTAGLYGHDLATDEPVDGLDDNKGFADVAPVDVLDCLVASHGTTGAHPRLDAAVEAAIESNRLGTLSPALNACEYPE